MNRRRTEAVDSTIWKRSKQVFNEALEKTGPQRMSFVAAACGKDRELRAQVDSLLDFGHTVIGHHEQGRGCEGAAGVEGVARRLA